MSKLWVPRQYVEEIFHPVNVEPKASADDKTPGIERTRAAGLEPNAHQRLAEATNYIVTAPNLLTGIGVLAVGAAAVEASRQNYKVALPLAIAGFSMDFLDGGLARRLGVDNSAGFSGGFDSVADFTKFIVAGSTLMTEDLADKGSLTAIAVPKLANAGVNTLAWLQGKESTTLPEGRRDEVERMFIILGLVAARGLARKYKKVGGVIEEITKAAAHEFGQRSSATTARYIQRNKAKNNA
jgi:hypothetical protein